MHDHSLRGTSQAFVATIMLAAAGCFHVALPARAATVIAGDLNGDVDVDVNDAGLLASCLTGSGWPHDGSALCEQADLDHDGDVDMVDFGTVQPCFTGPGIPGDPACGGCVRPRWDRPVGVVVNPIAPHQSTLITVADSQVGVAYQLRLNEVDVNDPVAGTGGSIELSTGNLTSDTTFNVVAINAAWGCSVPLAASATVIVNPLAPKNKIGVHSVSGPRNGFADFLQHCAAAGKSVALVKCVDDFGAATDAKLYSPQTLTIGRLNDIDGYDLQGLDYLVESGVSPQDGAAWYFSRVRAKWMINRERIDVWETCNEWSWHYAWQADFYIAFMDLAEAEGFRLGLWMASGGNPPEQFYPEIARACVRAKAHGNHILCLHEYAWSGLLRDESPDLVTRYRRLYSYLADHDAVIPLAITEAGENGGGGFVGTTLFVEDFGWYDTQMRQDDYVIGCAAWTLGNWGGANFQDALPALADYIIAH